MRSGDINDYIKQLLGEEHSSKDFRTWHATVLAALDIAAAEIVHGVDLATTTRNGDRAACRRAPGNTPTVCRASYIDPQVFDRFLEGRTIAPARRCGDRRRHGP